MFISILINSLVSGGMFAILAVGFSLVFGVAKILNMAHTAFYMVTVFLIFITMKILGLALPIAAILSIIVTALLGIVCYKLCFDRVKVHQTAVMIISVAIAILFQEIFLIIFTGHFRRVPPFIPGFVTIAGVPVLNQHFFTAGASLVTLIGLWLLLSKTRLGKAIRAVEQDIEIANLFGINVSRISMLVMGISVGLAGIAGLVIAPVVVLHPLMWTGPLVIVLAAVVLGGMGSIKGSIIAAYILGFAETLVVFLVPGGSFLRGAVSLAIMVVVLLVRPEGLLGVAFEEERL
ncbi:MAG: branched-chain amino acid ABC transporter permease [Thermodesulfobacteriota bacterium]